MNQYGMSFRLATWLRQIMDSSKFVRAIHRPDLIDQASTEPSAQNITVIAPAVSRNGPGVVCKDFHNVAV